MSSLHLPCESTIDLPAPESPVPQEPVAEDSEDAPFGIPEALLSIRARRLGHLGDVVATGGLGFLAAAAVLWGLAGTMALALVSLLMGSWVGLLPLLR